MPKPCIHFLDGQNNGAGKPDVAAVLDQKKTA